VSIREPHHGEDPEPARGEEDPGADEGPGAENQALLRGQGPPLPDGLLGPLLDSAGEALRQLPPDGLPPAARRLRAFDRRGLATPAARRQLRRLLEDDEELCAVAAALLLGRPDASGLAAAWQEATAAGGDAPLRLVSELGGEGRLPLLASVLAAGRPGGFEFGLGLIVARADLAGRESEADRALRAATAREGQAEEAQRRADAARSVAEAELARADAALRDERAARRRLEQEAAGRTTGAEARLAEAEAAVADAERRAEAAEERARAVARQLEMAKEQVADAARRVATAEGRAAEAGRRAEQAEARLAESARRAEQVEARLAESARRAEQIEAPLGDDERIALGHVARVADELAAWLHHLAAGQPPPGPAPWQPPPSPSPPGPSPPRSFPPRPAPPRPVAPLSPPASPSRSAPVPKSSAPVPKPSAKRAGSGSGKPATRRRAPVRLPPGMQQDDPAAIAAMVRTPGLAVIVDGYNVSMLAWPGASAAEQRERLCDGLAEFQLRFRCEVTVVFDGAEVPGVRPLRRRGLRVLFSAAGQEADEVLVGEVMFRPDDVPVIVVSSDREVQAAAEAEGAAVLSSDVLLALMHR